MALDTTTKLDSVFKKSKNKALSSTSKEFFEEAVASGFIVDGTDVFADALPTNDPTTAVASGLATTVTNLTLTEDTTVSGDKAWQARTTPGDLNSALLTNFIPSRYGVLYSVRIFNDDGVGGKGTEIASSDASNPIFDEKSGTLFFQSSTAGLTTPIHLDGYRYTGATVSGGVSGPGSATDNAIVRWDGTSGNTTQNSVVTMGDSGMMSWTVAGQAITAG